MPRPKKCHACHERPPAYVTRRDKDSQKLYLCEVCATDYRGWGIVSLNDQGVDYPSEEV